MSHPLEGVLKVVEATAASTGAGTTYCDLRPPEGCVWEILYAWGKQDDGAVWVAWYISDTKEGKANVLLAGDTGTSGVAYYLGAEDDVSTAVTFWNDIPIATYQTYFRYGFTASAGAKNASIMAVVKEFRGVQSAI